MKYIAFVLIGFLLGVALMLPYVGEGFPLRLEQDAQYIVTNIVDGDTIDVADAGGGTERVRLIGIDTPETVAPGRPVACYGPEATERMRELINGKVVTLRPKPDEDRDTYGRLLRYVFLDDTDIGAVMLEEGYAVSLCTSFPHPQCDAYERLQDEAEAAERGRHKACT